jgi:hypothetical protein
MRRLAVNADPIPGIRFGALLELANENDVWATDASILSPGPQAWPLH